MTFPTTLTSLSNFTTDVQMMDARQSFARNDPLDYQRRLDTFNDWPKRIVPDKYSLAKAGFLYTGQYDKIKCFACHVDPWSEHKRWSDQCWYLKLTGCADKNDDSVFPSCPPPPPTSVVKTPLVFGTGSNLFDNKPFQF